MFWCGFVDVYSHYYIKKKNGPKSKCLTKQTLIVRYCFTNQKEINRNVSLYKTNCYLLPKRKHYVTLKRTKYVIKH